MTWALPPAEAMTRMTAVLTKFSADDARDVARDLLSHPLSVRYIRETRSSGNNKIHTPAQVLGERIARIAALLMIEAEEPGLIRMNLAEGEPRLGIVGALAALALQASPYLWTEEVRDQIAHTITEDDDGAIVLPRHVISPEILPEPRMWWTYETGIGIPLEGDGHDGEEVTIDAQLLSDAGDRLSCTTFGEFHQPGVDLGESPYSGHPYGTPLVETTSIEYGKTYPDDWPDPGARRAVSGILSFLAFLNSPFIPTARARLSRQERRSVTRVAAPDFGDEVSFIMLRRPEVRRRESAEEGEPVDWKHRWIVSGHYRAQWYPTEQAHHVIWIAPYMKGPEDAPLLEHAYKVAR